jgi:hypothetical protein
MNSIHPLLIKARRLILEKMTPYFSPPTPRRKRQEVQLEFQWRAKR